MRVYFITYFEATTGRFCRLRVTRFLSPSRGTRWTRFTAAQECHEALASHNWPEEEKFEVRVGIHTGRLLQDTPDSPYIGLDVHYAARLCYAGNGRQILLSGSTLKALDGCLLPDGLRFTTLGQYWLQGLLEELIRQVGTQRFGPLRALNTRYFSVPLPRTSLVGRDNEIKEVSKLLLRVGPAIVTLTGTAGTGKTRLAMAVAAQPDVNEYFIDGICFVPLAPVTDPALVLSTTIRHLGLPEAGRLSWRRRCLIFYDTGGGILIVFDNFEHLMPAATLVASLLSGCADLKILITSRAALRMQGEQDFQVPSLLPNIAEAVALFVERAAAVVPGFPRYIRQDLRGCL